MYTRDTGNECLSRFVRNSEEIEQIGRLKKVDTDVSLDYILIRSARTHELYIDNAAICSQWIRPVLEEIEQCPPHIIQSLAEFAQALCEKEHCLDREAGFHVHQALLRYARQKGDRDFLIRELYHCGIGYSEYMTDKLAGVFGKECKKSYHNAYFFEGAEYLEHWREISDSKTMDLIIRCFLNRSGGYTERDSLELQHTLCQEALTVVNRADLRAAFPDLPWDGYALAVHMNVTAILNFARDGKCSQGIIWDIVRSARLVMQRIQQSQLSASRWQFIYYAARYHNSGISLPIFLEKIHELYVSRNQGDFSRSGIWANIKLPFIYLDYLVKCRKLLSAEEQEKMDAFMERIEPAIIESFFDYCSRFQSESLEATLIREICYVIDPLSSLSNVTAEDLLVNLVMQRHTPTYIHSKMVSYLAALLAEKLLDKDPMRFSGLLGTDSPEAILAQRKKVLLTVKQAGFFHDIGKLMCLEIVGIYNRRLFPEEFDIIKAHPYNGYRILRKSPSTAQYAQTALLHHRSFDGKSGYPAIPEDFVRDPDLDVLTDLVKVADLLDAATDTIGRSYSPGVELEQLITEYKNGYDTRYAGYVVDLLDDPELLGQIASMIDSGRQELYTQSYLYDCRNMDGTSVGLSRDKAKMERYDENDESIFDRL